jgi:hypothetical protein
MDPSLREDDTFEGFSTVNEPIIFRSTNKEKE